MSLLRLLGKCKLFGLQEQEGSIQSTVGRVCHAGWEVGGGAAQEGHSEVRRWNSRASEGHGSWATMHRSGRTLLSVAQVLLAVAWLEMSLGLQGGTAQASDCCAAFAQAALITAVVPCSETAVASLSMLLFLLLVVVKGNEFRVHVISY